MLNNETLQKISDTRTAFDEYFKNLDYKSAALKQQLNAVPACEQTGKALKDEMPLLLKEESALEPDVIRKINELGYIAATYNCIIPVFK